ncbi:Protein AF-9 ALL1-fused gene from chromosome 9 protein [Triplophysa tibetana]|uniref:Protein AF-9 ALL1-fused gene from chromosome 9 protein n=1 Tax=Triplophysa tibetana TaxID=1572043 RepID=A0A5A9PKZ0_9TELE|nr:Protein AF-9 ALL1-fused gene from chromosome 9 protein [Triplophysa tibetana]
MASLVSGALPDNSVQCFGSTVPVLVYVLFGKAIRRICWFSSHISIGIIKYSRTGGDVFFQSIHTCLQKCGFNRAVYFTQVNRLNVISILNNRRLDYEVNIWMFQGAVQVKLELGHRAQVRKKPTVEGFTHDWMVFVRGPEHSNIQHFVEKVVFHLHESFPRPKRDGRCFTLYSELSNCVSPKSFPCCVLIKRNQEKLSVGLLQIVPVIGAD